jgi:hypothetical protein
MKIIVGMILGVLTMALIFSGIGLMDRDKVERPFEAGQCVLDYEAAPRRNICCPAEFPVMSMHMDGIHCDVEVDPMERFDTEPEKDVDG